MTTTTAAAATDPSLSIVVVSYNTRELLRQCLASVAAHCPGAEVVVVDNASDDGSPEMVRGEFPGATLVALGHNAGFAAANNRGLPETSGEFVVLLNSDAYLEDDTLPRCARWMRDRPGLGAASPGLVGVDGRPQRCHYPMPTLLGELRTAARRPPRPDGGGPGWLAGTALMIRREALDRIGGRLDEAYFMYWEDADLSARLLRDGWAVAEYPDGHVRHHGGASGGGDDSRRRPDLLRWYLYGKHLWFARHRGPWEAAGLWLLGLATVPRDLGRALVRPGRRHDATAARVRAGVLARRALGLRPPRPRGRRPPRAAVVPATPDRSPSP